MGRYYDIVGKYKVDDNKVGGGEIDDEIDYEVDNEVDDEADDKVGKNQKNI